MNVKRIQQVKRKCQTINVVAERPKTSMVIVMVHIVAKLFSF